MLPIKQSSPSSVFKYANTLRHFERAKENLILLSKKSIKKFTVFLDRQVGISNHYQQNIQHIEDDQDYDSSEEIVNFGLEECILILTQELESTSQEMRSQSFFTQQEYDNRYTIKHRYRGSKVILGSKMVRNEVSKDDF